MPKQLPITDPSDPLYQQGRQVIFAGTVPNDGTGDSLRDAFIKTNDNFELLYGIAGIGGGFRFSKLYDTPEVFIPDALVTVNPYGDELLYRTTVSDDLMITITDEEIGLQLSPVLANNISFSGDTIFNGQVDINTKIINLANTSTNYAGADGAGIHIGGANASVSYQSNFNSWVVNKSLLPSTTINFDLGANSRKWDNIWGNNLNVDTITATQITGNITATQITGNILTVDTITATQITGTLTGTVSSIANHNSDELAEGVTNRYYTVARENSMKTYVGDAVTNLINGAPAALDTLNEIAIALGNDASLSATLTNAIASANAAIVTANVSLKSYVDAQFATTLTNTTNASALKANIADVNTQFATTLTNTTDALALKANIADVNTQFATTLTNTTDALALKANISSLANVAFTGSYTNLINTPTTVGSFINDKTYQTAAEVNATIQAVVGAAPAALDTLAEIAAQLTADEFSAVALTNVVATKASTTYVDNALALKANISSLANVAFSGSYNDLINKPTQVNSDWLATSGISAILNKPVYISSISLSGDSLIITKSDTTTTSLGPVIETVFNYGNSGTSITPDRSNGSIQKITANNSFTLAAPTNMSAGQSLTLIITQDATGGRIMSTDVSYKFAMGLKTLSTTANSVDMINMFYDGTNYYATLTGGYV